MISTISMQLEQPRRPQPIPTQRRASSTTGLIIATVLGAMLACFVLFGHRLVHAAPQATAASANADVVIAVTDASVGRSVEEARAAVTSLPTFPDAYSAPAGIAP